MKCLCLNNFSSNFLIFLLYKKQEENLRSTTNLNSSANMNSQQFELEAEALISLVNKLVSQIEDRLKGKFSSCVC